MSREMKHSGIPWIGEIPKDWAVIQLKRIKDEYHPYPIGDGDHGSIKPEDYIDEGIPYIRVQNMTWGGNLILNNIVYISKEVNEKNLKSELHPQDILIAKTGATIGKTAIIPDNMPKANTTSSVAKVTVSKKQYYKFIFYLLNSDVCFTQMWLRAQQKSAQPGFNIDELVDFIITLPSYSEQQNIAEFLDKKCGEVDEMITLQEQIIEELKVYKQSVITEAVTKGLNPNVTMKDSGIEWIGEIPEHWEIKKIKHLSHVVRGGSPRPAGDLRYYVGNIPFMKVADITKDDKIYVDKCEYTIKEAGLSHTRMIKPNTLLLTNSGATLGVPKINTFDTTFNDGIAAFLNLDISLDIIFAYYSLKARTQYFLDSASLGIGQPNLNTDIIGSTYLLVPPIYEQQIIVDFLNEKCADVDALISIKQRKIESLKEYKKSIIYEYVTGKKEVV